MRKETFIFDISYAKTKVEIFGEKYLDINFMDYKSLEKQNKFAKSLLDFKEYMDDCARFAKEKSYVETLFGRVIHTLDINAKGPTAGFAKRAAINAPIQGTAADIIRKAMIRMPTAISHLNAKMLLQVHDELLFEVRKEAVDETISIVKDVMETASLPALEMSIPLTVDAGQGRNWAEAH